MNYILLDFEWDAFYCPAEKGFVNEILQFGAVKLNEQLQLIDRFSVDVKSSLSKKLSGRFKALTGITNNQMLAGIPLKQAVLDYKSWAGEDTLTLTWSDTDLHVLHKNCALFLKQPELACLGLYADLQKIFHTYLSQQGNPQTNQISLENAAGLLNIFFKEENLHSAVDDSLLSAAILQQCVNKVNIKSFVLDTNHPDFYKRLLYKPHYINNIQHKAVDKASLRPVCPKCGAVLQRLSKWRYCNGWFRADFFCQSCKRRLDYGASFKQYYDRVAIRLRFFEKRKKPKNKSVVPK